MKAEAALTPERSRAWLQTRKKDGTPSAESRFRCAQDRRDRLNEGGAVVGENGEGGEGVNCGESYEGGVMHGEGGEGGRVHACTTFGPPHAMKTASGGGAAA
jgi:hypothetical protein